MSLEVLGQESFFKAIRADAVAKNATNSNQVDYWMTKARSNMLAAVLLCDEKWIQARVDVIFFNDFTKERRIDFLFKEAKTTAKKATVLQRTAVLDRVSVPLYGKIIERVNDVIAGLPTLTAPRVAAAVRSMASMFGSF